MLPEVPAEIGGGAFGAGDSILPGPCNVGVGVDTAGSTPSPSVSRNEANFCLFLSFLITKSRNPSRRLGCLSTTSRSCSFGSCSSAPKLAGEVILAQRIKPSQSCGFVQTFFTISREKRVVDTKLTRFLYVPTAWITYRPPLSKSISRIPNSWNSPFA